MTPVMKPPLGGSGEERGYRVVGRAPRPEEYRRLCEAVGWGEIMNFAAAGLALPRSCMPPSPKRKDV